MNHCSRHIDRLHHFLFCWFHHILQSELVHQQVNPFLHCVVEQASLQSFSIDWFLGCKAQQSEGQCQSQNRNDCSHQQLEYLTRKIKRLTLFMELIESVFLVLTVKYLLKLLRTFAIFSLLQGYSIYARGILSRKPYCSLKDCKTIIILFMFSYSLEIFLLVLSKLQLRLFLFVQLVYSAFSSLHCCMDNCWSAKLAPVVQTLENFGNH